MAALGVLLGYWLSLHRLMFSWEVVLAAAAAFCICGGGMAVNDFFDRNVDAKAKKNRPLPSGRIGERVAFNFASSLFLLGAILSLFVNSEVFFIAVGASLFLLAYSAVLLKYKYLGNWVVAGLTGLTFLFGAAISGEYFLAGMVGALAFLSNLGREISKDIEDRKADRGVKRSLPMVLGVKASAAVAAVAYLLAIAFSVVPFAVGLVAGIEFMLLLLISYGVFALCVIQLMQGDYAESRKTSKFAMAIALAAFLMALV